MSNGDIKVLYAPCAIEIGTYQDLQNLFKNSPKFKALIDLLNKMDESRLTKEQIGIKKKFFDNLADLRPFIISSGGEQERVDVDYGDATAPDLPFKYCSFELDTLEPVFNLPITENGMERVVKCVAAKEAVPCTAVFVALCYEVQPGEYFFSAIEAWDNQYSCSLWRETEFSKGIFSLSSVLREYLKLLLGKEFGTLPLRPYLHTGHGRHKSQTRPKDIIFIGPSRTENVSMFCRSVDWSHKWEVMGHWRTVDTIGKDRDGSYCINGKTWVKSHVKGKGALVKKTRVILPHFNEGQKPRPSPSSSCAGARESGG